MPLTKRQKRRLLETSKLILSLDSVVINFRSIQLEHAEEIKTILGLVRKSGVSETSVKKEDHPQEMVSTDLVTPEHEFRENAKKDSSSNRSNESHTQSQESSPPPAENAPEWAKKLWKQIAKKCHPDRLSFQQLTAIEIAQRQHWFLESRELYSAEKYNKLIHIGIQVGEYVDELPVGRQILILEQEHNKISQEIDDIQSSFAWQWGNSWENTFEKLRLLKNFLRSELTPIPSDQILLDIIKKVEEE